MMAAGFGTGQVADLRQYVRSAVNTSPADEIARLADLRSQGVIDEAEFQQAKKRPWPDLASDWQVEQRP